MSSFLTKLNLRPNELRLVVVAAAAVVTVLYVLFIFPQFKEWGVLKRHKADLEITLQRYQKEIQRDALYRKELAGLQEKGARVDSEAQALELQRIVTSQAALHAVSINGYTPGRGPAGGGGKTNAFFEEQTGTINFVAEESALANFLYALSSGNFLIRVSSMTLNPDPSRMKLMGNITVVASYKKAPVKTAPASPPPAAAVAVKPTGPSTGPKSISAAVSATVKPAIVTNRPPSVSWLDKAKGLFSSSKSTATNVPPKKPAVTNAPPVKK
jgi:hypothetical protein